MTSSDVKAVPIFRAPLTLDEATGRVRLGEREITSKINAQDFLVLACLFRNQGNICSKDLLVDKAWPDVKDGGVSDQAIAASIRACEKTLGTSRRRTATLKRLRGVATDCIRKGSRRRDRVVRRVNHLSYTYQAYTDETGTIL